MENYNQPRDRSGLITKLLWEKYGTELSIYSSGLCYSSHSFVTKDDLLSEFILRLYGKVHLVVELPKYKRLNYLKRVMKNLYLDIKTREQHRGKILDKFSFEEASEQDIEKWLEVDSLAFWARICEKYVGERNTQIILLHVQGYVHKEIAEFLKMSEASVRTAHSRAIKVIREKL